MSHPANRCYYDGAACDYRRGMWQCQTCHEWFCCGHWHETSEGRNVECVVCESTRHRKAEEEGPQSTGRYLWRTPCDWLMDKVAGPWADKPIELVGAIRELAAKLDFDQLIDIFGKEMTLDGYWLPIEEDEDENA